MIVLERHDGLDLARLRRIARDGEALAVAPALLDGVDAARGRMLAHLRSGAGAYGVTTGVGYLRGMRIGPDEQVAFGRALLRRGAGHGPALPAEAVRGALLLRLTGFLSGAVGVTAALCRFLVDRLNDGFTPWVPARGTASAGEVVALTHLFQTLAGDGHVLEDGRRVPAREALAARGVAPYEPDLKEGIALINGAPLAPALAACLAARCARLLTHATLAGALTATLAGASSRPYARRIGLLKADPGQRRVHDELAALLGGAERWDDAQQGPVSLRVLPQVHGAVHDLLDHVEAQLEREVRAVTDSPLFLAAEGPEPEGFYPSGNFHAQALAFLLDALAVAVAQVANLSERRLHRLLDARFSSLPEQLAVEGGGRTGLVFLHKSVVGLCVEARLLAAPAGVHQLDTSSGQEDVQAHALLAADKLDRALDAAELVVASELVADRQAHHLGPDRIAPPLADVAQRLAALVAPVTEERVLGDDVERVRDALRAGML
ncbi:MAG: aromatic amino acid lyase [Actinomycetota bacterium]|nr:aromatic amino acid lyase [Actinomycetota bacterium]